MNNQQALTAYTASFIDELSRNGVKNAVVCPGSRSTPLALLLAEHDDIQIHVNIDERSAAFFALGMAKALKEPVAIVCTSGTAAANFYPAIVEAFYARIPLIVLTADRPHELRDVGAPQAIDQLHLYGKHVKWFVEMAIPEETDEMVRYSRTVSSRAVATSLKEPAGPVHLNFPLREPLVPNMKDAIKYRDRKQGIQPAISVEQGALTLSAAQFMTIANQMQTAKNGLIICGELKNEAAKTAILSLAEKLSYPLIADPLSQLRSSEGSDIVIDCYDTFLRDKVVSAVIKPDFILRFGSMPVSKSLTLFIKQEKQAQHIVVDGGAGWREPLGMASEMIYCDESIFCEGISARIHHRDAGKWFRLWSEINAAAKRGLQSIREEAELSEGKLFLLLNEVMPQKSNLFVGNSMPIRDIDTFFFNNDKKIRILANRGANGIDGVVSTALGVSTVLENTVLVIGDLSFFHDMNGLMAAKLQKQNLTILLINNDGGGIFSFLPQSSEKDYFEQLFGTPHGLDFSHAAAMYGGEYSKVGSWTEFQSVFEESFQIPGLKIIEVPTERESNVMKHRELWKYVSREINSVLEKEIQ